LEEHGKIYWHDAHHEALQLELYEYEDVLEFVKEHELSKEALRMDTLIIKKVKDVQIKKNIGQIFRGANIVEFKSEKDNFDYWDYQKVMGYAHMYASFEKVHMTDITVSISLTIFPRDLVKSLERDHGYTIVDNGDGIHYLHGAGIPVQILESKNLSEDENLFLRNLRSNLNPNDVQKTLQTYSERKPLDDKNAFIDRLAKANRQAFKEAASMFTEGLREIWMEVIDEYGWMDSRYKKIEEEAAQRAAQETAQRAAQEFVQGMLLHGLSIEDIANITKLPIETIIEIANQLQELPANA